MNRIIDENTVKSSLWGVCRFAPVPKGKNEAWACAHCILHRSQSFEECELIPCRAFQRTDGVNGYFTIRQIPIEPLFPPSAFK